MKPKDELRLCGLVFIVCVISVILWREISFYAVLLWLCFVVSRVIGDLYEWGLAERPKRKHRHKKRKRKRRR